MERYRIIYFSPDNAGTRLPVGALVQKEGEPATWVQAERLPCPRCVPDEAVLATLFLGLRRAAQLATLHVEARSLGQHFESGDLLALPAKWPEASAWLREHVLPRRVKDGA